MWSTQKLTPMSGMDPMQQKMMQTMPLIFGVVLAFLPAGLVLYQVANGGLGLLQQWLITKKYAEPPPKPLVEKNRSEEHTSELQSLMRISLAVSCLHTKKHHQQNSKSSDSYSFK